MEFWINREWSIREILHTTRRNGCGNPTDYENKKKEFFLCFFITPFFSSQFLHWLSFPSHVSVFLQFFYLSRIPQNLSCFVDLIAYYFLDFYTYKGCVFLSSNNYALSWQLRRLAAAPLVCAIT
jgi:hypothetical protein